LDISYGFKTPYDRRPELFDEISRGVDD